MKLPPDITLRDLDLMIENTGGDPEVWAWNQDRPLTVDEAVSLNSPHKMKAASIQLRRQADSWEHISKCLLADARDDIPAHDFPGGGNSEAREILDLTNELKHGTEDVSVLLGFKKEIEELAGMFRGAANICREAAEKIDGMRFERFAEMYAREIKERMQ